jgi:hypothetical protein
MWESASTAGKAHPKVITCVYYLSYLADLARLADHINMSNFKGSRSTPLLIPRTDFDH